MYKLTMRNVSRLAFVFVIILPNASSFLATAPALKRKLVISSAATLPSPSSDDATIDLKRARECVEHFGACKLEEVEGMRNALKAERIKDFISTSLYYTFPTGAPTKPWNPNDSMEKRLLEQDLSHQLDLLKQHEEAQHVTAISDTTTHFVQQEEETKKMRAEFIPHASYSPSLATTTEVASTTTSSPSSESSFVHNSLTMVKLLNELTKEEIVFIGAVALLMMFPQLIHI